MLEMGTEKPIVLHVKYLILTTNKLVKQFSNKFSDLKHHKIHSVVLSLLYACEDKWIEEQAILTH